MKSKQIFNNSHKRKPHVTKGKTYEQDPRGEDQDGLGKKNNGEKEGLFGCERDKLSARPVHINQICQIIIHLFTSHSLLSIPFHSCILNLALTSDNQDLASRLFSDLPLANSQGSSAPGRFRRHDLSSVVPRLGLL